MSEVRAITNLIGNAVATVAIARWDNALDLGKAQAMLRAPAGSEDPAAIVSDLPAKAGPRPSSGRP